MTHNATISIAAKWLDDAKNQSLTAEQRAQADKNYKENVRTIGFPEEARRQHHDASGGGEDGGGVCRRQEQTSRQGIPLPS